MTARAARVDLRDSVQIEQRIESAVAAMGGVDTIVNQAGVLDYDICPPAKYGAKHLRASGRGPSLVNASSVSGLTGYPGRGVQREQGCGHSAQPLAGDPVGH